MPPLRYWEDLEVGHTYSLGSKTIGSLLIARMKIAGL